MLPAFTCLVRRTTSKFLTAPPRFVAARPSSECKSKASRLHQLHWFYCIDTDSCSTSGSHSGDCEDFCLLRHNAMYSVQNYMTFRRNISLPSPESKYKPNNTSMKQVGMLVSCLNYSSSLGMEATCSSETSVDFQWISLRYIPEDRTLRYSSFLSVPPITFLENISRY
jgi:hypothetical protein